MKSRSGVKRFRDVKEAIGESNELLNQWLFVRSPNVTHEFRELNKLKYVKFMCLKSVIEIP